MPGKEIYPNPTVKNVIFGIDYPNLFFLESKIGDLQLKVIEKFPESSLMYTQQFLLANINKKSENEKLPREIDPNVLSNKKIWQFKSQDVVLNISSDNLNLSSTSHKTYDHSSSAEKFRDNIEFVVNIFLELTKIPKINRIGLRYINECPIFEKSNKSFGESFNTVFDLSRFDIAKASELNMVIVTQDDAKVLRYAEALVKNGKMEDVLNLDLDASMTNIRSQEYLTRTDELHELISREFQRTIREPIIEYMKKT